MFCTVHNINDERIEFHENGGTPDDHDDRMILARTLGGWILMTGDWANTWKIDAGYDFRELVAMVPQCESLSELMAWIGPSREMQDERREMLNMASEAAERNAEFVANRSECFSR